MYIYKGGSHYSRDDDKPNMNFVFIISKHTKTTRLAYLTILTLTCELHFIYL